jgi:hypothetical protein
VSLLRRNILGRYQGTTWVPDVVEVHVGDQGKILGKTYGPTAKAVPMLKLCRRFQCKSCGFEWETLTDEAPSLLKRTASGQEDVWYAPEWAAATGKKTSRHLKRRPPIADQSAPQAPSQPKSEDGAVRPKQATAKSKSAVAKTAPSKKKTPAGKKKKTPTSNKKETSVSKKTPTDKKKTSTSTKKKTPESKKTPASKKGKAATRSSSKAATGGQKQAPAKNKQKVAVGDKPRRESPRPKVAHDGKTPDKAPTQKSTAQAKVAMWKAVFGRSLTTAEVKVLWAFQEVPKGHSLYCLPDIPPHKLDNAKAAYASIADNEVPIALGDNTVFGSAKKGIVITTKGIYWKWDISAGHRPYTQIVPSEVSSKGRELFIAGKEVSVPLPGFSVPQVEAIARFLVRMGGPSSTEAPDESQRSEPSAARKTQEAQEPKASDTEYGVLSPLEEKVLSALQSVPEGGAVHKFPRIPKKKLANAQRSFAHMEPDELLLCLVDLTNSGSARTGVAMTTSRIHWKQYTTVKDVQYSRIDEAKVRADNKLLHLNETMTIDLKTTTEKQFEALKAFILWAAAQN